MALNQSGRARSTEWPVHGQHAQLGVREQPVQVWRPVLTARIPDPQTLAERVTAWFTSRNARRGPVRWRFTTADARIKLQHLYPTVPE